MNSEIIFPTENHKIAFYEITEKLIEKKDVRGILLIGSLACGDGREKSDIDLYVISEQIPGDGEILIIKGIEIQIQWRTIEHVKEVVNGKNVATTMMRNSRIIYDPAGILKEVTEKLSKKFSYPYLLEDAEITAIRIFLSGLSEEMQEIEDGPYFNYIYYDRISRLISYFYPLKRLWKVRPKYIIRELKNIDYEFYNLICMAYEVKDRTEKIRMIGKISEKCLGLTDGPLYEGLYKIF